jgi:hypothetical protein
VAYVGALPLPVVEAVLMNVIGNGAERVRHLNASIANTAGAHYSPLPATPGHGQLSTQELGIACLNPRGVP